MTPNARKNQLLDFNKEDGVRLKLKSPPVDGKANQELLRYLSKLLSIPRRDIILTHGKKSRIKKVEILSLDSETVACCFRDILTSMEG